MTANSLDYRNRWLAYFDLLGFRTVVERNSLGFVLRTYNEALKRIDRLSGPVGKDVHITWASDAFLFWTDDDSKELFQAAELFSMEFFRHLFSRGIPLRGCLHCGQLYVDEARAIFLGPALIKAYEYAEGQDWLGVSLTEEAREELERYEVKPGVFLIDKYLEYRRYREWPVSFKGRGTISLLAYTMDPEIVGYQEREREASRLWNSLITMQSIALEIYLRDAPEGIKENVRAKYENTKDFLLEANPELAGMVVNRDRQINPPPL